MTMFMTMSTIHQKVRVHVRVTLLKKSRVNVHVNVHVFVTIFKFSVYMSMIMSVTLTWTPVFINFVFMSTDLCCIVCSLMIKKLALESNCQQHIRNTFKIILQQLYITNTIMSTVKYPVQNINISICGSVLCWHMSK